MTTTFNNQGNTPRNTQTVMNPATNGLRRDVAMNRIISRRMSRMQRRATRAI